MGTILDIMNAPDQVNLRKAKTYADFSGEVNPYGSKDVAATDEAIRNSINTSQANALRDIMLQGGPSGVGDRIAYNQESALEQAAAKRLMDQYAAQKGMYQSYLNQLSREDQARNAVANAQTQAANSYANSLGQLAGQLGGVGIGAAQWYKSAHPQKQKPISLVDQIKAPGFESKNIPGMYDVSGLPKTNLGLNLMEPKARF